ncbi:MAG: hypothetical protein SFU25_02965 [Candidatus Caenarcaniphilales bacterium]|nr:hypothetical protein [Candidatus Caenarcaniphilales bacterium]
MNKDSEILSDFEGNCASSQEKPPQSLLSEGSQWLLPDKEVKEVSSLLSLRRAAGGEGDELIKFDQEIDRDLEEALEEIRIKSRALASSLYRCFEDARKSERFEAAFTEGFDNTSSEEEILKKINEKFEEKDFMTFREFVRLLRACSLHIGGHISGKIKNCYNRTLKEDRILIAYNLGKQLSSK